MGAGFPFRMKMLWNRMEVVDAEYHECTKDHGLHTLKKLISCFHFGFLKKEKQQPTQPMCSVLALPVPGALGPSPAWPVLPMFRSLVIRHHPRGPPAGPLFIYLLTFWPPISPGRRKFPDQGSNLRHSINLSHSDNARSLCHQGSNPL